MRTDVKVGIVVAVCLAIIAVFWWFIIYGRGEGRPAEEGTVAEQRPDSEERNVLEDVALAPGGLQPAEPQPGVIEPSYRERKAPPAVTPPSRAEEVAPRPMTPLAQVAPSEPVQPAKEKIEVRPAPEVVRPVPERIEPVQPRRPPAVAEPKVARPYVIQPGDHFWGIAQRMYGDGGLWAAIQEANPGLDPQKLRAGMTITLPPKPAAPARLAAPTAPAPPGRVPGSFHTDPVTGKRFYVVKAGDQGFWDVAAAAYGHGRFYRVIEAANPDLDPHKLGVGQLVWVPERPAEPVRPPAAVRERPARPERSPSLTARPVRSRSGAPTTAVLPDGRVFD